MTVIQVKSFLCVPDNAIENLLVRRKHSVTLFDPSAAQPWLTVRKRGGRTGLRRSLLHVLYQFGQEVLLILLGVLDQRVTLKHPLVSLENEELLIEASVLPAELEGGLDPPAVIVREQLKIPKRLPTDLGEVLIHDLAFSALYLLQIFQIQDVVVAYVNEFRLLSIIFVRSLPTLTTHFSCWFRLLFLFLDA